MVDNTCTIGLCSGQDLEKKMELLKAFAEAANEVREVWRERVPCFNQPSVGVMLLRYSGTSCWSGQDPSKISLSWKLGCGGSGQPLGCFKLPSLEGFNLVQCNWVGWRVCPVDLARHQKFHGNVYDQERSPNETVKYHYCSFLYLRCEKKRRTKFRRSWRSSVMKPTRRQSSAGSVGSVQPRKAGRRQFPCSLQGFNQTASPPHPQLLIVGLTSKTFCI